MILGVSVFFVICYPWFDLCEQLNSVRFLNMFRLLYRRLLQFSLFFVLAVKRILRAAVKRPDYTTLIKISYRYEKGETLKYCCIRG